MVDEIDGWWDDKIWKYWSHHLPSHLPSHLINRGEVFVDTLSQLKEMVKQIHGESAQMRDRLRWDGMMVDGWWLDGRMRYDMVDGWSDMIYFYFTISLPSHLIKNRQINAEYMTLVTFCQTLGDKQSKPLQLW